MHKNERREYPRFPLRNEKIKILLKGKEKVFALRDISCRGLGIELSEFGELLLFPINHAYRARLNLSGEIFPVDLVVQRVDAATVGMIFQNTNDSIQSKILEAIDPLKVGQSLKKISVDLVPESFREGISMWFHGDPNADLFLWLNEEGVVNRALFLWNGLFWEWSTQKGIQTGDCLADFNNKQELRYHQFPQHKITYQVRKILENTAVLDYRLLDFLLQQK